MPFQTLRIFGALRSKPRARVCAREAELASDAAQVEAAETAEKAEKGEKGKKRGDNGDVSCGMAGPAKCETQTKQRKKKAPTENVKVE